MRLEQSKEGLNSIRTGYSSVDSEDPRIWQTVAFGDNVRPDI